MTNEHTLGNYFIIGVAVEKLSTEPPCFDEITRDTITRISAYGLHDPDQKIFWTKVPAFIPQKSNRQWQPMGQTALEAIVDVLAHCRDGALVELRKGSHIPAALHSKAMPIMLPALRSRFL